ncbi:MAG TPA: hypothetical protein VH478_12280 [Trebonia sp.]|jgi:hypothetical protein|nr:hypothetical protein [Trebonia sp.]
MMLFFYLVAALLVLVLIGTYLSWRAGRLDRLHARTDNALTALDLALVRRSASAYELAASGALDPATSLLLADAAGRTKDGGPGLAAARAEARALTGSSALPGNFVFISHGGGSPADGDGSGDGAYSRGGAYSRDLAESDLTRALRAAFSQPGFRASLKESDGAEELVAEVEAAAHQVFLARKFYNDVAARTIDARHRPLARVFHLSGTAAEPAFFEMEDSLADEE